MKSINLCNSDSETSIGSSFKNANKENIFSSSVLERQYNSPIISSCGGKNHSLLRSDGKTDKEAFDFESSPSSRLRRVEHESHDELKYSQKHTFHYEKRKFSEFAEQSKKSGKDMSQIQNDTAKTMQNNVVEILDDTDEESFELSTFAKAFESKGGMHSISRNVLENEENLKKKSHAFAAVKDVDHDNFEDISYRRDLKGVNSNVSMNVGQSSCVVDLLSPGGEELLDSSPTKLQTAHESPYQQSPYESTTMRSRYMNNSFESIHHATSPVHVDRKEKRSTSSTVRITKPSGRHMDGSSLNTSHYCLNLSPNSDSDDSSLPSPSCLKLQHQRTKSSMNNVTSSSAVSSINNDSDLIDNLKSPTPSGINPQFDNLKSPTPSGINPQSTSNRTESTTHSLGNVRSPVLPVFNQIGGKLYPDLRNLFIKALISHAKVTRRAIYQRGALNASIRAINILSLYPHPIRTAEAGSRIKGIGPELLSVLKEAEQDCKGKPYNPPKGKFSSVAASTLVAILTHEKEYPDEPFCSMEKLIVRINRLTHHTGSGPVFNRDISHYLKKDTIDPGWMQILKLCGSNDFLKKRRKNQLCESGVVFQLMEQGREEAGALKRSLDAGLVSDGPLRQLASKIIDEDFGNVTMSIDSREGGGNSKSLHKFCDLLDEYGVPFVVKKLKISDYVFFVGDKIAPILIERNQLMMWHVVLQMGDGRSNSKI